MITIEGGNEVLREQVLHACEFYMQELFSDQMIENISVKIVFIDLKAQKIHGACEPDTSRTPPRRFNIELERNKRPGRIIEDLAHEMVHAKQYAYGELRDTGDDAKSYWHGELVECNIHDNLEYWDAPWEHEAFGRGYCLYAKYRRLRKRAYWRGEDVIGKL